MHLKAVSDRLIMAAAEELTGPDVLVVLLQGTTLATGLKAARPDLNLTFWTPEHFFLTTLRQFHTECRAIAAADSNTVEQTDHPQALGVCLQGMSPESGSRIRLVCAAEPPLEEFDSIAFPTHAMGSAEQTQELLQMCHLRLREGGRLVVSTNNAKDKWLHERLSELFEKTTVCSQRDGVLYKARRGPPLRRIRDFRAEFAFRHGERLVFLESLPGVFSHRRVDAGARALIRSLELLRSGGEASETQDFRPKKIVDLGCGCGAVAIAAALDFPEADVLAVDSHARAVACTGASAARNQIDRIRVMLASDAVLPEPGTWDLLLTNPPYYSDFRISELFLQAARAALRPGGRMHLVTKLPDWHLARINQLFSHVHSHRIGDYDIITATAVSGPGR